ncbi:MAG: MFS transporter, partial [Streptomyces sp.]
METAPPDSAPRRNNRRKVAAAAAAASAVEWYDYFIFGIAAALILGGKFFPSSSPVAEVLASFATFAVGFLARPLGGIIAGQLGDKRGRKPMLVLALVTMGLATTGIGLLPSYDTIGIAAPIALVALRVLQGLAVGAQWGGAMLMATEYAPEGKRGLYGSLVQLGVPIGVVTANVAFLVTGSLTDDAAFAAWGWRMPFAVGILVLVLAWYIHKRVEETPEFRQAERELAEREQKEKGADASGGTARSPLRTIIRHHFGTVLLASGSFAVNTATFYIIITGVLDYTTRDLHMERTSVLTVSLLVSLTQFAIIPAAAAFSDRVGRLPVYTAGAIGLLVWAVPMFLLIDTTSLWLLGVGTFVTSFFLSIMYGPQAALFAELFTAEMRYTGASLGYQIAAVFGGGLAPFLMVLLLEVSGTSMAVSGYIMLLAVISLAS